jgi:predicted ArsR family transcriptional regulator
MAAKRMKALSAYDAIATLLARTPKGLTTRDASVKLGMPERTVRKHLARLYAEKQAQRAGEYDKLSVFHYRYLPYACLKAARKK